MPGGTQAQPTRRIFCSFFLSFIFPWGGLEVIVGKGKGAEEVDEERGKGKRRGAQSE